MGSYPFNIFQIVLAVLGRFSDVGFVMIAKKCGSSYYLASLVVLCIELSVTWVVPLGFVSICFVLGWGKFVDFWNLGSKGAPAAYSLTDEIAEFSIGDLRNSAQLMYGYAKIEVGKKRRTLCAQR